MSRFEVICITMHQNDFSKIKQMNIHSDVVFANQCDHTSYEEIQFEEHVAKMISTETRGVGINRNFALSYATADICLLADDDVKYHDDMAVRVVEEFENHPDADVIIFHFTTDDSVRKQPQYSKTKKWSKLKGIPWGGARIAFKLNSIKKANVWFTPLFGGGAIFPSGEDSMFLMALRKAGLTFYVSKETIGHLSFEESTWFTGYNEKFFFAKGAFYQAAHPKTKQLWALYFAYRTNSMTKIPFRKRINWMKKGSVGYKNMLSYGSYNDINSNE